VEDALGRHRTEAPDELSEHLALEPGEALFLLPGLVVPAGVAPAPDRQARRLEVIHERVPGDGVARLVDRDGAALALDVLDPDLGARLERCARLRAGLPLGYLSAPD